VEPAERERYQGVPFPPSFSLLPFEEPSANVSENTKVFFGDPELVEIKKYKNNAKNLNLTHREHVRVGVRSFLIVLVDLEQCFL